MSETPRLIGKRELLSLVPYTIQHIYRMEKRSRFPKRVRLSENRVAWLESEVRDWIAARVNGRGAG